MLAALRVSTSDNKTSMLKEGYVFSIDIDECTDGSAQCDSESTTCRNLIPLYECNCKTGYLTIPNNKYKCQGIGTALFY